MSTSPILALLWCLSAWSCTKLFENRLFLELAVPFGARIDLLLNLFWDLVEEIFLTEFFLESLVLAWSFKFYFISLLALWFDVKVIGLFFFLNLLISVYNLLSPWVLVLLFSSLERSSLGTKSRELALGLPNFLSLCSLISLENPSWPKDFDFLKFNSYFLRLDLYLIEDLTTFFWAFYPPKFLSLCWIPKILFFSSSSTLSSLWLFSNCSITLRLIFFLSP